MPASGGARVLGGLGGRQLPWARLLEGRLYLFLFLTIGTKVIVPGHNHLAWDAVLVKYSVGLAEVVNAINIRRWATDSTRWPSRWDEPTRPCWVLPPQTPRSSHSAVCSKNCLRVTHAWGPVHLNHRFVQALESKGPELGTLDPPFPSPGAEKMQNNPTFSKWQDHYFSQFEIIILAYRHWSDCRSVRTLGSAAHRTDSGQSCHPHLLLFCTLGKECMPEGWISVSLALSSSSSSSSSSLFFHFLCLKASIPFKSYYFFCFLNIFFWTICYTFHNQTMLKFYFNTMTKTRFTLKYSRIHSAQACSSKVEWEKKAKFLYKGLAFPFSPLPSPLKFLYFFFPTWFPIQESCVMTPDSRLVFFFLSLFCFYKCCLSEQKADVTLLQQISKKRH